MAVVCVVFLFCFVLFETKKVKRRRIVVKKKEERTALIIRRPKPRLLIATAEWIVTKRHFALEIIWLLGSVVDVLLLLTHHRHWQKSMRQSDNNGTDVHHFFLNFLIEIELNLNRLANHLLSRNEMAGNTRKKTNKQTKTVGM